MQPVEPVDGDPFVESALLPVAAGGDATLRRTLLAQTSRQLRVRRRLRLAGRVSVVIAAFIGGMIATIVTRDPAPTERIVVMTVPVPIEVEKHVAENPGPPARRLTPAEVELEAEKTLAKAQSSRLFREAGDRFLREEQDYQAALRCYRNFLDEAAEADLAAAESDTWLLASLKNARRKETENDSQ
jgi:hypothetical protein